MKNLRLNPAVILAALCASAALVGCETKAAEVKAPPTGSSKYKGVKAPTGSDAGIPLSDPLSKVTVQQIPKNMPVSARKDPFALTATEVKFDRAQRSEKLLNDAGGYVSLFTPTVDIESQPLRLEPRPLWRVSGVVISENGIVALLDKGTGSVVIRPGSMIEGTPFVVDSLSQERAVLRRLDGKEPKYVNIELSGPLVPVSRPASGARSGVGAGSGAGRPPGGGEKGTGAAD
jgi:hypothetical protein